MRFLKVAKRTLALAVFVLALPVAAQAQEEAPRIGSAAHHVWYDMDQATCVDRGSAAIEELVATAGFTDPEMVIESWYAVASWRDLHLWIYCFAGPGSVIDPEADQVLAMFVVAGIREDTSEIRNFLGDCISESVCPDSLGDSGPVTINWERNALDLAGEVGQTYAFACPPLDGPMPQIWGTDIYTADSPICAAAVHAGIITLDGGDLTIDILGGQEEYISSKQNGMASYPFGTYTASFAPFPPG